MKPFLIVFFLTFVAFGCYNKISDPILSLTKQDKNSPDKGVLKLKFINFKEQNFIFSLELDSDKEKVIQDGMVKQGLAFTGDSSLGELSIELDKKEYYGRIKVYWDKTVPFAYRDMAAAAIYFGTFPPETEYYWGKIPKTCTKNLHESPRYYYFQCPPLDLTNQNSETFSFLLNDKSQVNRWDTGYTWFSVVVLGYGVYPFLAVLPPFLWGFVSYVSPIDIVKEK